MANDYLITVITVQQADGETDTLEMTTHASLVFDGDSYTITYNEDDSQEGESTTVLKVTGGRVIEVTREGAINSSLTIEEGVRHLSHHVTPYGAFSLGISGKTVESDITEDGGRLVFRYATDTEMNLIGEIEFDIKLTAKKH